MEWEYFVCVGSVLAYLRAWAVQWACSGRRRWRWHVVVPWPTLPRLAAGIFRSRAVAVSLIPQKARAADAFAHTRLVLLCPTVSVQITLADVRGLVLSRRVVLTQRRAVLTYSSPRRWNLVLLSSFFLRRRAARILVCAGRSRSLIPAGAPARSVSPVLAVLARARRLQPPNQGRTIDTGQACNS